MGELLRRRALMTAAGGGGSNRLYLFDNGDECTAVTGGWETNKFFRVSPANFTAQNDGEYLSIISTVKAATAMSICISTFNPIDFSKYSKIVFTGDYSRPSGSGVYWFYFPLTKATGNTQTKAFGSNYSSRRASLTDLLVPLGSGIRTVEVDISNYNDSPYLVLNLNIWGNAPVGTFGKALSIYLE